MPKKIRKLTPDQIARFAEWTEQWIKIGLSTEPADFDKAIDAALRVYKLANLKKPMIVLRVSSPYGATLGGRLAWAMLRELENPHVASQVESQVKSQVASQVKSQVAWKVWSRVESQVKSQVWSQVGSQVESQVWSQVKSQVESQVESQVKSQVWSQVGSQVESQVKLQVWSQVKSQVWSQVKSHVASQVWSQVASQVESQVASQVASAATNGYHGSLYAGWAAYISFLRDVCGWENAVLDRFEIDETLVRNCGWVWWHENILAVSDRPLSISRDAEGRLHSETGPSIAYRDGWQLHHWHGVSVPEEWLSRRDNLTPKIALTWENIEQRRAACEILGWSRILTELNAKTINKDGDPEIGELVEVELPEIGRKIGREKFLRVQCGTKREFAIPVPPTMKTALEAQAWTWGLTEKTFAKPEIRT